MSKRKRTMPTIEKEVFEIPCRIHGCNNRAKYRLGNMKGSPMAFFHVCEDCMKSMLESLPKELLPDNEETCKKVEESIKEEISEVDTNIDIENIGYREMQKALKEAGLNATGTKEEVTERYINFKKRS